MEVEGRKEKESKKNPMRKQDVRTEEKRQKRGERGKKARIKRVKGREGKKRCLVMNA